jgi:branched-chain amino acid transport system permease protein
MQGLRQTTVFFRAHAMVSVFALALGILLALTLVLSEFQVSLLSEMLIVALFAMSLHLILGLGGMVSFGHATFYGIGAYTVAIATLHFGVSPLVAMLIAPFCSALVGLVLGWFCVRLVQLYFSILTLAFGQLFYILALQGGELTGGDNGLLGIPKADFLQNDTQFYVFTVIVVCVCGIVLAYFSRSPFVLTLKAIRENPERAQFIGVDVRRHQLAVFVIAAFFAGIAGALMAQHHHLVAIDMFFWTTSAEPLLGSLLGGMYSLLGTAIGGALLILLESVITRYTVFWSFVLGLLTIGLVLIFPNGLAGGLQRLREWWGRS